MRILVMSLGTRGDVEPMIAIAEILWRHGHEVNCAFPEQFRHLVEANFLPFLSPGSEYMASLETGTVKKTLGGYRSELGRIFWRIKLIQEFMKIEKSTNIKQYQVVKLADPELIVHNKATPYPFVWRLDHPGKTVLISIYPYHWIMPQVYGVVHHGGSGTLHTTLKYGCASFAIPHIVDQFMWNKVIYEKGLGPKGMKINKINKKGMEVLITDLYNNPEYKINAEHVAEQMKNESSEQKLLEFITGELPGKSEPQL